MWRRRLVGQLLLDLCDLDRTNMPRLVEGNAVSGQLRDEIARDWGIDGRPVVAGGGGDNAAAAVGLGTVTPGDSFLSLGTSGVVFTVTDSFAPAAERSVPTPSATRFPAAGIRWASSWRQATPCRGFAKITGTGCRDADGADGRQRTLPPPT